VATTVTVWRAQAADIDVLAEVHLRSALYAYEGIFPPEAPKPAAEALAMHWQDALDDGASEVFAAEVGGEIVGGVIATTATSPGVGNLRHLYVDPRAWGQGAGRRLHDAVVDWCVEAGVVPIELWVLERNDRARAMYERWGWVLDGVPRFTNPGTDVSEVRYTLVRLPPR
jgi:GNAT superfamily N-acetyltransferase